MVAFAALMGAGAGFALTAAALGWLRCPLAALYHIPCPGCGMTRAVVLLFHGRIGDSLRMNALAAPVLGASLALAYAALQGDASTTDHGRRLRAALMTTAVTYGAAVALWGLRWFGLFGGPVPV